MNLKHSKFVSIIVFCVVIVFVSAASFIICYDWFFFSKCRNYLGHALEESKPTYTNLPACLIDIVYLDVGPERVRRNVIQITLAKQLLQGSARADWHFHYFLCDMMAKFYYSEKEIFTLWCSHAPYEKGIGLNQSAIHRFNRELNDLTLEELITIVVVARAPALYGKNLKLLDLEVSKLMETYHEMYLRDKLSEPSLNMDDY